MSRPRSDQDLLFGMVALQNGLIDQEALIAAFRAWSIEKSRALAEILEERAALSPTLRAAVEALVAEHIRKHGGDPQKSLAALSPASAGRTGLQDLGDDDLAASLAVVGASSRSDDSPPAMSLSTSVDSWPTLMGIVAESTTAGPRFRIIRPHARGGLGAVFVAVDTELNREVALKQILDQHADRPESRSRFVREAEITGGLEHPGIVPVYSLGRDPTGRPFYAMRFIKGDSLKEAIEHFHGELGRKSAVSQSRSRKSKTRGADASPLAFRQLLRRFVDVCNALGYAHSRGVLHRDIKPSNIMVGRYGETLVVDWGLAKVIGTPETSGEATLRPPSASDSSETLPGTAIGTPAFMSPEQAAGDLDRLGPASDVYSLGATLYYLLTGQAPFEGSELGPVIDRVRRGDFPPPRQLKPEVPRPLEAICLKAMALLREDRYPDCRSLADDIERWLADEPVSVYVEPWPARVARWGRRHRSVVATAVAILATATVGLTTGLVAVSAEKNRTEVARQGEAWQRARAVANEKEARDKADESRAVLDFVKNNILAVARPEGAKGGDLIHITLLKALQLALPEVKSSFERLPLVESEVRVALGESFLYVGDAGTAERQFQIARERYTAVLGPLHPVTLSSMNNLANAYAALGRHVDALELNEKTLALRKSKLGPDHRDTLSSMNNLANNYRSVGRHAEALKLYEEVLTRRKSELGPDHPDTLMSMTNLASTYAALGRLADALKLFDEALATAKAKLGPDHPVTLAGMINLAGTYAALGRHADALKLREETLAVQKAKLGPDHPDTLLTMNNLAVNYSNLGRHADALKLNEETLALLKANLGTDHPDTLLTMANLAGCLLTLDRRSEALAIADDCLRRANGKTVDPRLVPFVLDLRLRVFAKQKDASGCRQTAGMWEKLARTDADSLYTAACFRAVTAGLLPARGQAPNAESAMGWLKKAVAAGYNTPRHLTQMTTDSDLDALRDRPDFNRLLAELFDRGFPADPFAK